MRTIILLLLAALLAGCTDATPAAEELPPGKGVIRGVVVDQAIRPVEAVEVKLQTGETTLTDATGAFRFDDLDEGDYFLSASKAGYFGSQASTTVVAGVAEPPAVKIIIEFVAGAQPFAEVHKLDGFYECAFSYGNDGSPVITDSCDFGWRTVVDEVNETVGNPGAPRNLQNNINTMFFDVGPQVMSIVQEGVWESSTVDKMMILLSSTPIANSCDCSERDYLEIIMESPTYGRIDAKGQGEQIPRGETVAARGFLDWNAANQATNFQFSVFTVIFHNVQPPEGWSFIGQDPMPF